MEYIELQTGLGPGQMLIISVLLFLVCGLIMLSAHIAKNGGSAPSNPAPQATARRDKSGLVKTDFKEMCSPCFKRVITGTSNLTLAKAERMRRAGCKHGSSGHIAPVKRTGNKPG